MAKASTWSPSKRSATVLVTALAVIAIVAPILTALVIAHRSGLDGERARVSGYARDVLARNDALIDQQYDAFRRLKATGDRFGPCSPEALALMRQIDLSSNYLHAVGRVVGTTMTCSSLGQLDVELGAVDVVGALGTKVRAAVTLSFAPGTTFIVSELYGYAAIVSNRASIDLLAHPHDISLATYSVVNGTLYASTGSVKPAWARLPLPAGGSRTFRDGGRLVTVTRSARWQSGSIASMSAAHIDDRTRRAALILLPIGLATGALLAAAVVTLARMQLAMPTVLRSAFRRREFYVEYQPVVDLATGRWEGAEALVRWRRSSGEQVRPDFFMPIVEDEGLGRDLTAHVLELIHDEAADLFRRFPSFLLHVNLTPDDLREVETIDLLRTFARDMGAGPGNLSVEATERDFLDRAQAQPVVSGIQDAGIKVVIDDFGTGYSSLSYLETFAFDGIKIDKAFVDTVGTEAVTGQVVFQIIRMATELDYEMVAEGVEHVHQAETLRDAGVRYAQGWLYAKSMAFDDLVAGLVEQQAPLESDRTGGQLTRSAGGSPPGVRR